MEIKIREIGTVVVLDIAGEIDAFNSAQIHSIVLRLVGEKKVRIILNMQKVPYIDSTGIGLFLQLLRRLRESQGGLKLVHISAAVRKVFELTRLIDNFEIFDAEDAAMKSFA